MPDELTKAISNELEQKEPKDLEKNSQLHLSRRGPNTENKTDRTQRNKELRM